MIPLLFLFEAWAAFWAALLESPRHLPAGVTDIREGHAIRARRAQQGRRL